MRLTASAGPDGCASLATALCRSAQAPIHDCSLYVPGAIVYHAARFARQALRLAGRGYLTCEDSKKGALRRPRGGAGSRCIPAAFAAAAGLECTPVVRQGLR